jgi:hypothetical protein
MGITRGTDPLHITKCCVLEYAALSKLVHFNVIATQLNKIDEIHDEFDDF